MNKKLLIPIWAAIVTTILLNYGCRKRCTAQKVVCGPNLQGLGVAIILYTSENDGRYPRAEKWCDLLISQEYVPPEIFICEESRAKVGQSSYALNKNLAGMKMTGVPGDVVMLFESTPGWNQVGGPEILTTKNHGGEGCNILFNDGSVLWVRTEELGALKWKDEEGSDVEAYVDELTGFESLEGIRKSFERVDVNDDNTPFLHREINGKKDVWRIEIRNVRLKLKSAVPGFKDKYVRNFEVLIDPNTGHLLKITSRFDGNAPDMLPEPPAAVAEAQMRKAGEIYHGFPADPPEISLLDALGAVGRGNPLLAKEIYAVYVMRSSMGSDPRPVWAVTLRGLPPLPVIGHPRLRKENWPPVWQRNYMRNVVDAVTGRVLFATNIPGPLPPEEKNNE